MLLQFETTHNGEVILLLNKCDNGTYNIVTPDGAVVATLAVTEVIGDNGKAVNWHYYFSCNVDPKNRVDNDFCAALFNLKAQ